MGEEQLLRPEDEPPDRRVQSVGAENQIESTRRCPLEAHRHPALVLEQGYDRVAVDELGVFVPG